MTTVSAPGKVLLAGGYLVLESPNVGLVIATNKRFYCTVKALSDKKEEEGKAKKTTQIIVKSPQFHSVWEYECTLSDDSFRLSPAESNQSLNGFIEKTLRITLGFLTSLGKELPLSLELTIRADNDFYSVVPHLEERGLNRTPQNVENLPKFLPCPQDSQGKAIVNKTGLGSSAALVTSCVGALLESHSVSLKYVHNLAQICHCHAQGKVGSGFDVSAAVHGSHVYQRFPKCTLPDLLHQLGDAHSLTTGTMELLKSTVKSKWAGGVQGPIVLPPNLELMLADVCGGSESPSMARKVLSWKQARPDVAAEPFWEDLGKVNTQIVELFQKAEIDYPPGAADQWEGTHPNLYCLHSTLQSSRKSLKRMGDAAGVPIEPPPQTALADATMQLPGVVAAVVPGAGGYDALACLYINRPEIQEEIGTLWSKWSGDNSQVCPLAVKAGKYGEGLRVEEDFDCP